MQFPVPQFIDVEDKIIGPLTLKQFGFVAAGGLVILGLFKLLGLGFLFYLLSLPIAGAAAIIAFGSYNGMKLYNFLPVIIKFLTSDRILVFHQQQPDESEINIKPILMQTAKPTPVAPPVAAAIEEPVQSRLKKLAMQLDQRHQEEFAASNTIRKQNVQK